MSKTNNHVDYSLDKEIVEGILANENGFVHNDDHEDKHNSSFNESVKKYHINPRVKTRPELLNSDIILSVRNLKQFFFFGKGPNRAKLKAVSNVSFDIHEGECFGIVGESGCGKTESHPGGYAPCRHSRAMR